MYVMTEERVTGVIPDLRTGRLGRTSYSLIITDRRLIFAEITNELLKKERKKSVDGAQGGGFMSRWKASLSSNTNFHERYYKIPPEYALSENPNNYEMRPEEIQTVKLRDSQVWSNDGKQSPNKMVIRWSGGKNKYDFQRVNTGEAKKALVPLLGPKVH